MKKLIFMFLFCSIAIFGQQKNADKLLQNVIQKFDKVNDYQADLSLKVDITFAKIPDMKATIYFKRPDKVHIESKGFALLPKQSVNFSPSELLKGDHTALYVKSEMLDGHNTDVIKIIPSNDSSDVILSTLWIDESESLIRKVVTNGKNTGTTTINLAYDNTKYSLPSKIVFSFNLGNVEMPEQMQQQQMPQQNQAQSNNRRNRLQSITGTVTVIYSNYKINKGIPDSIFEEKNNSGKSLHVD